MKNNSNIYDIDGELIRAIDDTHKMSIEEAQEKIEYYRKKIEEVGEDSEKAIVYATYMRNLTRYIWELYAKMTPKQLKAELEKKKSLKEQVENALNELKESVDEGPDVDNEVEQPVEVPAPDDKETVMDEYVNFEEVK